jgi:peptidoglycan/xylan/chitin deacetylase (PgdA/CDA1 family)
LHVVNSDADEARSQLGDGGHVTVNGRRSRAYEVLNLCFHGIGTPGRALEPDEELYWVDEAQFDELLEVIVRYPSVRITFDDANASDAALALPALRRQGLTATFFILSGRLDQPGSLARADVRSLTQEGMTIGSHGMRHVPWRSTGDQELEDELGGAAEAIADAAGRPVRQVAFPFGSYDRRVLAAVRRHGFSRAYTVDGGAARSDAWIQSRYTIRSQDTPVDVERLARSPHGNALPAMARTAKSFVKRWR